jgi:hypothetical protein
MSQQNYIDLQVNSALSVFMRKVRVAFTPPGVTLTAKMNGGYVIRGKNK